MHKSGMATFCMFCFLAASSICTGSPYLITDLGNINQVGKPFDINDNGQILLGYENDLEERGCLWENGELTNLDRVYSRLNTTGQMVNYTHFRDSDGVITAISGTSTLVFDINNFGQYVGSSISLDGRIATIWDYNAGTQVWMGKLNEYDAGSYAMAVNDSGFAVGYFHGEGGIKAFLWDTQNGTASLLGEGFMRADDINDNGQILCTYEDGDTMFRCLWDQGVVTNLGDWWANSINNSNEVVGSVILDESVPGERVHDAILWKEGMPYSLDTLLLNGAGWDLISASNNNNRGQIAGIGILNGEEHAYLLTPIPEPATVGLMLLGGMAVLRRRKIKETR